MVDRGVWLVGWFGVNNLGGFFVRGAVCILGDFLFSFLLQLNIKLCLGLFTRFNDRRSCITESTVRPLSKKRPVSTIPQ